VTRAEQRTLPGRERRPTLADVATRAGVSTALVSIVIRGAAGASAESRQRVLRAADELGYRPDTRARLLRSSHSRLLGVVFGVQHAFHGDLVGGLYQAADRIGYELALSAVTPTRDEPHAVYSLLQTAARPSSCSAPKHPRPTLADLATRLPVSPAASATAPSTRPFVQFPRPPSSQRTHRSSGTLASSPVRAVRNVSETEPGHAGPRPTQVGTMTHRSARMDTPECPYAPTTMGLISAARPLGRRWPAVLAWALWLLIPLGWAATARLDGLLREVGLSQEAWIVAGSFPAWSAR
jgi:hypothetical protein